MMRESHLSTHKIDTEGKVAVHTFLLFHRLT